MVDVLACANVSRKETNKIVPPPKQTPQKTQLTKTSGICHFMMSIYLWGFFDQIKNNEYFTCKSVYIMYIK